MTFQIFLFNQYFNTFFNCRNGRFESAKIKKNEINTKLLKNDAQENPENWSISVKFKTVNRNKIAEN
jgi:hypothetical protein